MAELSGSVMLEAIEGCILSPEVPASMLASLSLSSPAPIVDWVLASVAVCHEDEPPAKRTRTKEPASHETLPYLFDLRQLETQLDEDISTNLRSQPRVRQVVGVLSKLISSHCDEGSPAFAAVKQLTLRAPAWLLCFLGCQCPQPVAHALIDTLLTAEATHTSTTALAYLCIKVPHGVIAGLRDVLKSTGDPLSKVLAVLRACHRTVGLAATVLPVFLADLQCAMEPCNFPPPYREECADETIARDFANLRWEELGPSLLPFAHIVSRLSRSHSTAGWLRLAAPLLEGLLCAVQRRLPATDESGDGVRKDQLAKHWAVPVLADFHPILRTVAHSLESGSPEGIAAALLLRDVTLLAGLIDPAEAAKRACECFHDILLATGSREVPQAVADTVVAFYATFRFHVSYFFTDHLTAALAALPQDSGTLTLLMLMRHLSPLAAPAYLPVQAHHSAPRPLIVDAPYLGAPVTLHAEVLLRWETAYALNGVLQQTWRRAKAAGMSAPEPSPDLLAIYGYCLQGLREFVVARGISHAHIGGRHPLSRTNIPGGLDDSLWLDPAYLVGLTSFLLSTHMRFFLLAQQNDDASTLDLLKASDSALFVAIGTLVALDEGEEGGGNLYALLHEVGRFLFVVSASSPHAEPPCPGTSVVPPLDLASVLPLPIPRPADLHTEVFRIIVHLCHVSASAQATIPGRALHMLTSLLIDWTSCPTHPQPPLAKYSELLPHKVPFERDIFVSKLFGNYPILWTFLALLAEDRACFAELLDVIRSLLVLLIGHWHSAGPQQDRSEHQAALRHSVLLIEAMGKGGYLPPPFPHAAILLPFLKNSERAAVLHDVWNFLLDFPPRRPSHEMYAETGEVGINSGAFHGDRTLALVQHRERQRQRARRAMADRGYDDAEYLGEVASGESDAEGSDLDDTDSFGGSDSLASDEDGDDMALGDEEPPAEGLEAGDDAFVPMEGIEADPGAEGEAREGDSVMSGGDIPGDPELPGPQPDNDDNEGSARLGGTERADDEDFSALTSMLCGPQHKGQPATVPPPDALRFALPSIPTGLRRLYLYRTLHALKAHPELAPYMSLFYPATE